MRERGWGVLKALVHTHVHIAFTFTIIYMQSHNTYYILNLNHCRFPLRVAQHVCSLHLNSVQRAELYFYVRGSRFTTFPLLCLLLYYSS